jgi:hypothetical protein
VILEILNPGTKVNLRCRNMIADPLVVIINGFASADHERVVIWFDCDGIDISEPFSGYSDQTTRKRTRSRNKGGDPAFIEGNDVSESCVPASFNEMFHREPRFIVIPATPFTFPFTGIDLSGIMLFCLTLIVLFKRSDCLRISGQSRAMSTFAPHPFL